MVTKKEIEDVLSATIDEWIIKCGRSGTKPTSGPQHGQGEMPKFEAVEKLTKKELDEIADKMCERWGLEVSINNKGKREIGATKFSLWDEKNKTLIKLDKLVKKNPSWLDFTNNDRGKYNLDDVLRYYDEMPDRMKEATGGILFETTGGADYNTSYDGRYDVVNPVVISGTHFNPMYLIDESTNLQRCMYHEGGHSSSGILPKEVIDVLRKTSVGKNSYNRAKLTNDNERKIYDEYFKKDNRYNFRISNSKEYDNSMEQDKSRFASRYGRKGFMSYSGNRKREENWAETLSMASFRNLPDKKNAVIQDVNGNTIDLDTFISEHESSYKLACDFLDGKLSYDDFHTL